VLAGMLSRRDCAGGEHGLGAEVSSRMSPGFQVESLRKLAAIFVSFFVLGCGMLPLEDRITLKAFRVALVCTKSQHLAEAAEPRVPLDVYGKINCFSDLSHKMVWAWLRMSRLSKLMPRFLCRVGMSRRQRTWGSVSNESSRVNSWMAHSSPFGRNYLHSITKSNDFSAACYSREE